MTEGLRSLGVMTEAEYLSLPESIRGPDRERVGVVELSDVRGEHAPRSVRVECRPELLKRAHGWLEAVTERNGWSGRVRSWVEMARRSARR